jgi:hypothetical protein
MHSQEILFLNAVHEPREKILITKKLTTRGFYDGNKPPQVYMTVINVHSFLRL